MRRKKIIKIITLICCGLVFVIGFSIGERFFLTSSSKTKKQEAGGIIQPKLEKKKPEQKQELGLSRQEKEEKDKKIIEEKKIVAEEKEKEKEIEKEEEKELISQKKQPPKISNIHIASRHAPLDKIQKEEKKYYYKKQIFASAYKEKALEIKRLILREFHGVRVDIKPAEVDGKLIYRVILLSKTPQQIEDVKKRIEGLSKTSVIASSRQPTKPERQIQIFATSDINKVSLIKKHLRELNYDVEVIKAQLQPENIIYRIYLQGSEEKIIKQAQDIKDNKIIENIVNKSYFKKEERKEEKKEEDKYIIQVASLTNAQEAENLLKQLRETSRLPAYIKVVKMGDRVEYKVRFLGFNDKETTIKFAQELLAKGVISHYIILKE